MTARTILGNGTGMGLAVRRGEERLQFEMQHVSDGCFDIREYDRATRSCYGATYRVLLSDSDDVTLVCRSDDRCHLEGVHGKITLSDRLGAVIEVTA